MTPIGWDDGFSQSIGTRITVRPMLYTLRVEWRNYVREHGEVAGRGMLFRAPYYFGPPVDKLTPEEQLRSAEAILGYTWQQEAEQFRQLDEDISFHFSHGGKFARHTCDDCKNYVISDEGFVEVAFNGEPMRRNPLSTLNCECPRGCPRGHYSNQKGMKGLSLQVWRHYWRCQAVGFQPLCPIIMRNWSLIGWIVNGRTAVTNPFFGGANGSRSRGSEPDYSGQRLREGGGVSHGGEAEFPPIGITDGGIDPIAVHVPDSGNNNSGL